MGRLKWALPSVAECVDRTEPNRTEPHPPTKPPNNTYTYKTKQVTIYEARDGLTARLQESYPIGLNPRGVKALDRADPDLALAIRQRGAMVDAWRIMMGGSALLWCC